MPSIPFESPKKDENRLGTQTVKDERRDNIISDYSTSTSTSLKPLRFDRQESKERENGSSEGESDCDGSSSNSDYLPDLNDPTCGKTVKTKVTKLRKKRRKGLLKSHPKLMTSARKTFEHKSFLYKLSKDYIRSSKAAKEKDHKESHSHLKNQSDHHGVSTLSGNNLSRVLPPLSPYRPSTPLSPEKRKTIKTSPKSNSEIMNLKVKESLARYIENETSNPPSDDAMDSGLESLNTLDAAPGRVNANNINGERSELCDSDESDSTVIFENPPSQDICHIESVHSLSAEPNIDDSDLTTFTENVNRSKRKDTSCENNNSDVGNKKLRKDQEIVDLENDVTEHPMVVIPIDIANQQYSSSKQSSVPTTSQTHKPVQAQSGPGVLIKISPPGNTNLMENKDTMPQGEVTVADFHMHENTNSLVENVAGTPTSIEGDNNCEEDITVVDNVSGEVGNQNQTPNRSNLDPVRVDDQGKSNDDLNKMATISVGNSPKSFIQMSRQFKELTTMRNDLENNIRQVKEEYNKKIEALEEQKKVLDMNIKKVIDALSGLKELSKDVQSSDEQRDSEPISPGKQYLVTRP